MIGRLINRLWFHFFDLVFRLLARWRPPIAADLDPRAFRRILVFSAAGIGDTLTDSPAIRALKETFPQARLTVVTHRRRAVLARHNPFVDEVALYHKSLLRFVTLSLELRGKKPDVVIMLRGNDPDLWPMAYLVNRRAVISCPVMTRFKYLISHPVAIPEWDRTHGVEQTLQIVRRLGADTPDRRLVYCTREDERERMRGRLREWGTADSAEPALVVFQAGGGRRSAWRDWPVEHYAALGRRLLEAYAVRLVLAGGADLRARGEALSAALPAGVLNLVGRLLLEETAALLSLAKILVATDTGIMHLGFAVGVDTLALIHCNNPVARVGPHGYGGKHLTVQLAHPPGEPPSKAIDMAQMTPDQVWPKLRDLCERHAVPKRRDPTLC